VDYCSPFDEAIAASGPPAVFLRDHEGGWRFQATWSRDLWGRAPGPHEHVPTFVLARDRASGFVQLVMVTSPTLLVEHPRLDLRSFDNLADAEEALAAIGAPPIAPEPW